MATLLPPPLDHTSKIQSVHIEPFSASHPSTPLPSCFLMPGALKMLPAPHWLRESKARMVPECKRPKRERESGPFGSCALAGHSPRGLSACCLAFHLLLEALTRDSARQGFSGSLSDLQCWGLRLPRYYPVRHVAATSGTLMTRDNNSEFQILAKQRGQVAFPRHVHIKMLSSVELFREEVSWRQ